uniref:Putative ovule protein n=1 Tax=Solanum chacoense TaxID=4108 RepID=A0A0V0GTN2_SOLCH
MLQKMGFGSKWIRWIKYCIGTVKFSVLINRSPTGFFSSQRGLRQGDPLSPFLFILAMEGMSSLINTAKAKDWIRGFQVQNRASNNLEITHLQYADDTLVFCEAVRNHFLILRTIFIIFKLCQAFI